MIDKAKIEQYLDDLYRQTADLDKLSAPNKEYLKNPAAFKELKAIKYSLLVAIEDVVHISAHLVAALGLGRPSMTTAADLIKILGQNKIIPKKFADQIAGMVNFRNRLVHEYLPGQLDIDRLYEAMNKTNDFVKFAKYIIEFLEKSSL